MLRAVESGYVQREIQEAAYEYQRAIEKDEAIVVGVNRFQDKQDSPVPTLRIDKTIEIQQIERVQAVRARRDAALAATRLSQLEEAARGTANVLPRILECVEAEVTVGEISNQLRRVWGEYRETFTI
jgi:methylmalonyl-CoA mutase N-terminal domain/subunit